MFLTHGNHSGGFRKQRGAHRKIKETKSRRAEANRDYAAFADKRDSGAGDSTCCGNCLVCPMSDLSGDSRWTLPMDYEGYGASIREKYRET